MMKINNVTFVMLVGLPGSGKTTFTNTIRETYPDWVVLASDEYRKNKYGNESIQGDNNSLFEEIHKDIYGLLNDGTSVVLDATNLSRKHRTVLLNKIKKLNVFKLCYLFATEFNICTVQNNNRDRQVPEFVLERMRKSFNIPLYSEGWNRVEVIWNYSENNYGLSNLFETMDSFNQENKHHRLTLGSHSQMVYDLLDKYNLPRHIRLAGLLHDVGKLYTKTFQTMKGEPTEDAHYFGHEYVSSYEAMFYLKNLGILDDYILEACSLIEMHMRMYQLTNKSQKKIMDIIGENNFNYLEKIHRADKEAH